MSYRHTLSTHRSKLSLPPSYLSPSFLSPFYLSESAPELLGYDVQKLFLSSDDSAVDACNSYDLNIADGQIFEAFPTSTCIVQQQVILQRMLLLLLLLLFVPLVLLLFSFSHINIPVDLSLNLNHFIIYPLYINHSRMVRVNLR